MSQNLWFKAFKSGVKKQDLNFPDVEILYKSLGANGLTTL